MFLNIEFDVVHYKNNQDLLKIFRDALKRAHYQTQNRQKVYLGNWVSFERNCFFLNTVGLSGFCILTAADGEGTNI